ADLSAALLLGASVEGQLLRDKFGATLGGVPVLAAVAWPWPWLPVLGAGLSAGGAGLQALLGGSRLLRALARTRALPLPRCPCVPQALSRGRLWPLLALSRGRLWPLLVTLLTAALGVLLGSLDLLAPVLSVLCLTSHLGLNLACALQGLLPTAGWSPRCPLYHWSLSLAGALLCLSLMFVTCWHCALLALGIGATAYKYLEFRSAQSEWGEGLRGLSLSAARLALLRLEDGRPPPPSLRPQMLVLSKPGDPRHVLRPCVTPPCPRVPTAPLMSPPGTPPAPPPGRSWWHWPRSCRGGGRGLTVLGAVLGGALHEELPRARGAEKALRVALSLPALRVALSLPALRVALSRAGARGFVQVGWGWGRSAPTPSCWAGPAAGGSSPTPPGPPGTSWSCCGWRARRAGPCWCPRAERSPARPRGCPRGCPRCRGCPRGCPRARGCPRGCPRGGSLDVWWVVGTGRLLTLLPLLLRQHPVWRGCPLRLFTVALLEDNSERLRRLLEAVVRRRGLPAQVHVVELHDGAVSDYTYERTLMMEQRSQMLRQLRRAQGGPAPSHPPSAAEEDEGGGGEPRRGPSP
ncbi:solute carrier family 12 member 4-like, partial [Ammospiza maritima maritima]